MDASGKIQPNGVEGEVCIKGDNVTKGYENNEEANKSSFINGWFRTGDQGFFDSDGYLKISGRLKEIINRGGEKISPLEIDNVLMEHESIEQVVTFGVKDKMLGETIGVAIVIKPDPVRVQSSSYRQRRPRPLAIRASHDSPLSALPRQAWARSAAFQR